MPQLGSGLGKLQWDTKIGYEEHQIEHTKPRKCLMLLQIMRVTVPLRRYAGRLSSVMESTIAWKVQSDKQNGALTDDGP